MELKQENASAVVCMCQALNLNCFDEQLTVTSTGLFIKKKAVTPLMPKPVICPIRKFGCALSHHSLMKDLKIPEETRLTMHSVSHLDL